MKDKSPIKIEVNKSVDHANPHHPMSSCYIIKNNSPINRRMFYSINLLIMLITIFVFCQLI